jgi:hypothetical protein
MRKMGRLYKVQFYDHCVGIKGAMKCEAVGWLIAEDKDSITISPWRTITNDKEVYDNNHEYITILKKVIIKSRWLR